MTVYVVYRQESEPLKSKGNEEQNSVLAMGLKLSTFKFVAIIFLIRRTGP